jgi:acyl-homoserine-lactone acylase
MALALGACGGNQIVEDPQGTRYAAEIRWTSHGIPHISGETLADVAFGQGYALTRDHGCTLADQVIKVRSERAKFHGRGEDDIHLNSDLARLHMKVYAHAEADYPDQPDDVKQLVGGFAAGYNHFLEENGAEAFIGSCSGQAWVRPLSEIDLFAYYIELSLLASGRQLADFVGVAQPPGSNVSLPAPPLEQLGAWRDSPFGSNGWGIGKDLTDNGRGKLFANPHFPWEGELRLWESHLSVPGEMEVYGAGLIGVPGVLIGFNDAVAWTHTVSDGHRLTVYELELDPDDPTKYVKDGETKSMDSESYTVEVLGDDGELREVSRTLWRSEYGPMITLSPFGWTRDVAFTFRDANIGNRTLIAQFMAMNRAESMDGFIEAHAEHQGIPWVNTMSTSADGRAWYTDATPTPKLSQEALDAYLQRLEDGDFFTVALSGEDVILLKGNTSRDDWVEADGAREPGLIPFSDVPKLERTDFVFNANDSHWMTNPAQPLEGYSFLHGYERTGRSVRTRMNARLLTEGTAGFAGDDGKFDMDELQAAVLSNRSMSGELLLEQLIQRCTGVMTTPLDGVDVDISEACTVLGAWDGRFDLDSVGATVFREFLGDFSSGVFTDRGALFAVPFNPDDPVNTPADLAAPVGSDDRILEALAGATQRLAEAGLPVDGTLGDAQFTRKGDETIPIHGGGRREGVTNLITYSNSLNSSIDEPMQRGEVVNSGTNLTTDGYVVNYGSSFVMTLEYTDDGPRAFAFLTYGERPDPESEYFDDQTLLFSQKAWRPILFAEDDIAADVVESMSLDATILLPESTMSDE